MPGMRAIAIDRFGGPSVLIPRELPVPEPGPGEARVRVRHAGVNPVDWKIREGMLRTLLPHAFPLIPGWDVSGNVDACGAGAKRFKKGDAVFAFARKPAVQGGCYAEYVTVPETSLAAAPRALSSAEAGGVPLAALTAWQALEAPGLLKGGTALIIAAAGGVGGYALQLAKRAGMRALAVCSPTSFDHVRALGADEAVDYRSTDFVASARRLAPGGLDLVFDAAGGDALKRCMAAVHEGGAVVSVVEDPKPLVPKGRRLAASYALVKPDGAQLAELAGLMDKGELRAPPTQVLALHRAGEAQELSRAGHVKGKLVLEV